MLIRDNIKLQEGAIASIRTKRTFRGKICGNYTGGSDELVGPGGTLHETEPPLDLEK